MAIKLDKVDVVVIGTGFAGGIPSAELAKAGYKVVGLERGKDQNHTDFIGSKDELRYVSRKGMMQDNSIETLTSRSEAGEEAFPVRTQDEVIVGTDVGGNSVHWSGVSKRYFAIDFEIRSKIIERYGEDKIPEDMFLQDWGITYDEMEKYYDMFEKTVGISGEPDPLGDFRSSPYPTPPSAETPSIRLFKESAKALGYHPYQLPSGNITERYENPDGQIINACVYCSFCEFYGCDFGAKSDPVTTVIPTALETGNYELRTNSHARRIIYDGEKAKGVLYVDLKTGIEYEQPADVVVLAGYVFTNNRLLMLSEIGKQYDPETKTGVIGRNSNGSNTGGGVRGFFNDQKFNLAMGTGALGAGFSDLTSQHIDNTELDFIGGGDVEFRQKGSGPIATNYVPKGTPSWGEEFKEKSLFYANRNLSISFSHPSYGWSFNYMDLDPNYTDAFNDPLLRMTHRITEQDKNLAKYGIEKCAEIMEEMGADIIDIDEVPEEFNHRYGPASAGGVIMGDDPETSAVNNFSQMWDAENLFVIGASAMPHRPPQATVTIGAMAYRAAEGIEKYLKDGGGLLVQAKKEKKLV